MSDHTITWTQDRFGVTAKITCSAGPDATCHQSCPHGCEEWGPNHEHALADYGTCLAVEWMEATSGGALWEAGPHDAGTVPHDGPVTVSYSDGWLWEYTDQPTPSSDPAVSERMACAGRIQAFIDRHQGSVSDGYVRGLRAALLVVEHVDLQGQSLPSSPAATGATP